MRIVNLIHTLFSVLALFSGEFMLLNIKGTRLHKRIGYLYLLSMLILILTSFQSLIYSPGSAPITFYQLSLSSHFYWVCISLCLSVLIADGYCSIICGCRTAT